MRGLPHRRPVAFVPHLTSPFGFKYPDRDSRTMCQHCKNEDTDRVVDQMDLLQLAESYGHARFRLCYCYCCTARWHYEIP